MVITYKQNYIQHHGILGQKWGVRRFQNPDGSYTDEGKRRYRNTKDILKNVKYEQDRYWVWDSKPGEKPAKGHWGKKYKITSYNQEAIKNMDVIKDAHKRLKNAHQKVIDASAESTKFYENEKLVKEYQKIAANDYFEKYKDKYGLTENDRKNIEYGYMYEDLDQGDENSFRAYCDRNGISYKELEQKARDAVKEYTKEVKNVVSDMLGEYGNTKLDVTTGRETVASLVEHVLETMDSDDMYSNNIVDIRYL